MVIKVNGETYTLKAKPVKLNGFNFNEVTVTNREGFWVESYLEPKPIKSIAQQFTNDLLEGRIAA